MPGAHDPLALDEAVADPAAVVRADVVDDDELAAAEPRDRDLARAPSRAATIAPTGTGELVSCDATVVGIVARARRAARVEHRREVT